ncbi:glycerol-3-phosphate dehydrogenase [Paenibacillus algorifonticola]|uniref:Glycerol-3-phosphate dehydrogenase n=1 Tax=Paenibacillus algorifonticola TaxID=684063 RepID=A0A1I2J3F0_9BACL|nr:glycerol-3-phosphate dehydrogenase [Paenibacillus algorifonticola]
MSKQTGMTKQGAFSALNREQLYRSLGEETFDLLVIGGGITGAGIALDAQTRGLKTALVDMQDFAAGTSSRSTKLVHGGLRYLKQLEIGVVAEVGKERAIVYENGPHVTTPEWMLLPFYTGGTFGKFSTSLGLRVYDFLAGVKRGERRKMFSVDETMSREPLLKREGMKGGGYYVEYRTDDARLTIEVMKKAVDMGALSIPYVKVESFIYENGRVVGANVRDLLSGAESKVRAVKVVNATGPWVDTLREQDGSKQGKTVHLTKGVHLVFDQSRFPLHQAVYFDTPDGRMVFAIPRDGKTYIGTTDTNYKADKAHPRMTKQDLDYILQAANFMFPSIKLKASDVESSWAGLRPLIHQEGKDPSEISRKDEVFVAGSGLISIAGGKLTGYRKMAESVVNTVSTQLTAEGRSGIRPSGTKNLPLSGGDFGGSAQFPAFVAKKTEEGVRAGLSREEAERLARHFGTNVDQVLGLIPQYKGQPTASGQELSLSLRIELMYGLEYELTTKPADFWIRRTGNLLFDRARVLQWKDAVHAEMAALFGWSEETSAAYAAELEQELYYAVTPVDQE